MEDIRKLQWMKWQLYKFPIADYGTHITKLDQYCIHTFLAKFCIHMDILHFLASTFALM